MRIEYLKSPTDGNKNNNGANNRSNSPQPNDLGNYQRQKSGKSGCGGCDKMNSYQPSTHAIPAQVSTKMQQIPVPPPPTKEQMPSRNLQNNINLKQG